MGPLTSNTTRSGRDDSRSSYRYWTIAKNRTTRSMGIRAPSGGEGRAFDGLWVVFGRVWELLALEWDR